MDEGPTACEPGGHVAYELHVSFGVLMRAESTTFEDAILRHRDLRVAVAPRIHTSHYVGHNYVVHNYVGHVYIGHKHVSHNYVGHNWIYAITIQAVHM